ncbi:nitrate reductase molybdenum cofactor assembly chaperone [Blastococcus sp. Marseille-P5729]|uniref:nitrate reductase molybdenum cofactor assembly chaperone n=1 Tax=Blastococcus sp. Marseille-P5729 TaxID=2086582 RepID=UPI000D0F92B0|nr:nitrate reductase molybdenum cofactor assembly chaperone [Blastococcus sp. Marseille-P5729]
MLKWLRDRRTEPSVPVDQMKAAWQAVSLLLEYPGEDFAARLDAVRGVLGRLPEQVASPLSQYIRDVESTHLDVLQKEYVDTFDVTRKCCLHLTYYTHGDTRKRGVALVEFKQTYRRGGVQLGDEDAELPDYLPVVLEFGAFADHQSAWKLLNDHRVGIELLRMALAQRESRWLPVVEALRATLPQLDGDDNEALLKLIAQGPPSEDVGLDSAPYAMDPRLNPKPEPYDLGSTIPVGAPR